MRTIYANAILRDEKATQLVAGRWIGQQFDGKRTFEGFHGVDYATIGVRLHHVQAKRNGAR